MNDSKKLMRFWKLFSNSHRPSRNSGLGLLLISVLFFCNWAGPKAFSAQTRPGKVHLIAVGDTKDAKIGKFIRADILHLTSQMSELGVKSLLPPVVLTESDCSPDLIMRTLEQLKTQREYTVFFYFSGHGAYSSMHGQVLQTQEGPLSRDELKKKMQGWIGNGQIRLGVLMTDICNLQKIIDMPEKTAPSIVAPAQVVPAAPIDDEPIFQSLFLQSAGFVDVTSASADEAAMIYPVVRFANKSSLDMLAGGSLYTGVLIRTLRSHEEMRFGWNRFLKELVAPGVRHDFRKHFPEGISLPDGVSMQFTQTLAIASTARLLSGVENKINEISAESPIGNRLGIIPDQQIYEIYTASGRRLGVRVSKVLPETPADDWLDEGDIITSINGMPTTTLQQLQAAIDNSGGRFQVEGRDVRDGVFKLFPPQPGPRPKATVPPKLGVILDAAIVYVRAPEGRREGVRIHSVTPGTSAAGLLEPGDVVISINNIPTPTIDAFQKAVAEAGAIVRIRGQNVRTGNVEWFQPILMKH